jgi:hypothetical protein
MSIATSQQKDEEQQASGNAHQPQHDVPDRAVLVLNSSHFVVGQLGPVRFGGAPELTPFSPEDICVHAFTLPTLMKSNRRAEFNSRTEPDVLVIAKRRERESIPERRAGRRIETAIAGKRCRERQMKILTFMEVDCLMATTAFAETSKDELKRLGDSDVIVNELRTRIMAFQRITGRRRSVSS